MVSIVDPGQSAPPVMVEYRVTIEGSVLRLLARAMAVYLTIHYQHSRLTAPLLDLPELVNFWVSNLTSTRERIPCK